MTLLSRFNTPINRIILALWALLMALLMALTAWQIHATRLDASLRLQADAQRMAARTARILAVPAWEINEVLARSLVMTEMEDSRVYGIVVNDHIGFLEGQRRNENWESMPWDDLVPDSMIEGEHALELEEKTVGSVRVYLSPRLLEEDMSAFWWREMARFGISATLFLLFLLGALWMGRNTYAETGGEGENEGEKEAGALPQTPEGD